jgi:hypothetical protein
MIVYDNFIFITPNKTGTHSIEKAIIDLANSGNNKRIELPYIYEPVTKTSLRNKLIHGAIVPDEFKNLMKVLIVRNPYERLVSIVYFYDHFKDKEDFLPTFKKIRDVVKSVKFEEKLDILTDEELSDIGKLILQHNIDISNKQLFIWYKSLGEYSKITSPDAVIKLENAAKDLLSIGIDIPNFPYEFKNTKRGNIRVSDVLNTQEKIDFANEYFDCAKDAVRFGYKPIYTLKDLE